MNMIRHIAAILLLTSKLNENNKVVIGDTTEWKK